MGVPWENLGDTWEKVDVGDVVESDLPHLHGSVGKLVLPSITRQVYFIHIF